MDLLLCSKYVYVCFLPSFLWGLPRTIVISNYYTVRRKQACRTWCGHIDAPTFCGWQQSNLQLPLGEHQRKGACATDDKQPSQSLLGRFLWGTFFFRLQSFFCFQVSYCPVKRGNRAGSSRNEPDYSRRGTQISFPLLESRNCEKFGLAHFSIIM